MLRRHLLSCAILVAPFAALAQTYPDRPVKLLVGFAPGTGPDIVARTVGQKLAEGLKQPVVVDNRAGAGGQIAAQAVAKSAPDGYTILLGEVGSISIAPAAYSKLPYDPVKELVPVAEVVRSDFVLVVPATSPAKNLKEFIDAAKAKSDRVNFATFGAGTPGHFGAEVLGGMANFKVEPVHYRVTGDAITALIAGDVQAAFASTALAAPQVRSGKLRGLATTAPSRSPQLPDVPTFTEAGWPKADFSAWFAIFAPAGTPATILDALNRQIVSTVQSADVKAKLQEAGFSVSGTSRADSERMVREETQRWTGIVKQTGFKAD